MTAPMGDPAYRRLDGKLNALLVVAGIILLILILALVGVIDFVT